MQRRGSRKDAKDAKIDDYDAFVFSAPLREIHGNESSRKDAKDAKIEDYDLFAFSAPLREVYSDEAHAKTQRNFRLFLDLVRNSVDAISDVGFSEVDEQPQALVRQSQVGQQLFLVNR